MRACARACAHVQRLAREPESVNVAVDICQAESSSRGGGGEERRKKNEREKVRRKRREEMKRGKGGMGEGVGPHSVLCSFPMKDGIGSFDSHSRFLSQ